MRHYVACALFVIALITPAYAQVPAEQPIPNADEKGIGPGEEKPETRQTPLPVFTGTAAGQRFAIEPLNISGTNGEVYVSGPPAPYTTAGVLMLANTGTPDVSVRLGTNTGASGFGVFDSAGTSHFKILGDGRVLMGKDAASHTGYHFQLKSSKVNASTMLVWSNTTVDADVNHDDTAGWTIAYQDVAAGVKNTGGLYGLRSRAWLYGAGEVTATYGAYIQSGVYPSTTMTGKVLRAYGAVLDVAKNYGTIDNGYALYIRDVMATSGHAIYQIGVDDMNYFAGKTGIGIITPGAKLHVREAASNLVLFDATGANSTAGVQLKNDARGWQVAVNGADADKLQITDTTAGAARMTVTSNGNVGIGTTAPTTALHVVGSLIVSDTITAGKVLGAVYQDVAEWVPATSDLAPGTVVILNPEKNNEVMASHGAYDTTVAGIVSAQPGLILGVAGEGKEQIATTGRVKVRVDARNGAIRVGDLLVTGEIAGTAMKSEAMAINGRRFHQPGTIIGKALEPLEGGVGEILVLLSMQ